MGTRIGSKRAGLNMGHATTLLAIPVVVGAPRSEHHCGAMAKGRTLAPTARPASLGHVPGLLRLVWLASGEAMRRGDRARALSLAGTYDTLRRNTLGALD